MVFTQVEKALSRAEELISTLEDIRCDPFGESEEDAETLEKIYELLGPVLELAHKVKKHTGKGGYR